MTDFIEMHLARQRAERNAELVKRLSYRRTSNELLASLQNLSTRVFGERKNNEYKKIG